jgi:hypothetical protein
MTNNPNNIEESNMYFVTCGTERAKFDNIDDAKAFAQKESWIQSLMAEIRTPEGRVLKVKIGNTP